MFFYGISVVTVHGEMSVYVSLEFFSSLKFSVFEFVLRMSCVLSPSLLYLPM